MITCHIDLIFYLFIFILFTDVFSSHNKTGGLKGKAKFKLEEVSGSLYHIKIVCKFRYII